LRRWARAQVAVSAGDSPRVTGTVADHGWPAASRPRTATAPSAGPSNRPLTTSADPANRSGSRRGASDARFRPSPAGSSSRPVTTGVPMRRWTRPITSSSRSSLSTSSQAPPPSPASRFRKPSLTAVSTPTV
jgi:hypothetical protein